MTFTTFLSPNYKNFSVFNFLILPPLKCVIKHYVPCFVRFFLFFIYHGAIPFFHGYNAPFSHFTTISYSFCSSFSAGHYEYPHKYTHKSASYRSDQMSVCVIFPYSLAVNLHPAFCNYGRLVNTLFQHI